MYPCELTAFHLPWLLPPLPQSNWFPAHPVSLITLSQVTPAVSRLRRIFLRIKPRGIRLYALQDWAPGGLEERSP